MFKKFTLLAFGVVLSSVASASSLYYVNDNDQTLHVVDTVTFNSTLIGATGVAGTFGDMAWDRTTDTMYFVAGRGNNNLYTLDLTTGAATLVGSHGVGDLFGLAVNASGQLFAQSTATSNNFFSLNKLTGAATLVGGDGVYTGGLTFNTSLNEMILLQAGTARVYEVDESTGTTSFLGGTESINDNDIAYDATTDSYWAMSHDGHLYSFDSNFARIQEATGFGEVAAADFANPVPEPATLAVCAAGLAALLRRKRATKA